MKPVFVAAAAAALAVTTQAGAQPLPVRQPVPVAPATPMAHGQGGHGGWMADRTRVQAQQMADAMFQRFDVNRDGVLTRDEAQQALAQATAARGNDAGAADRAGGRAQRMLARMFGDASSVTLAQFEGQALARFDREDLNHDGVVTAAERQQGRANRAQ